MASRSLGTLTVDLIAKIGGFTQGMTQAERVADKKSRDIKRTFSKHAKDIENQWNGIGRALSAGFAGISVSAAVVQMVNIARETATAAAEVDRFAKLANTSTEDFQRLAYGANTVGISGEKLADILKDVQDKAGDFAQTGGGGMADFFENIAPRVGVTIEQFRRLSGPEALQLYVSSLERANLSQQDVTFYMEALANDATLLLPLLQNNGRSWKELGDQAERAGAIMGGQTLANARAYKEESDKLDAALKGLRIEVADQLLPVLAEMNRNFADPSTQGGIRNTISLLSEMASGVVRLSNEFMLGMRYADGFWDALFKYGTSNPFNTPKENLDDLRKELKDAKQDAKEFSLLWTEAQRRNSAERIRSLEQQIGYWSAQNNNQLDQANAGLLRNYRSRAPAALPVTAPLSPVTPPKGSRGKSQAEKDQEAAQRFLQSMRDQVQKSQERTAWEQLHYDIQAKGLKLSQDQLNQAQGLATLMDMAKEAELARSTEIDRQNTLYQLQERLMNAQQRHQLELLTYGMGDQAAQELRDRIALEQQQQAELRQMQHEHGQELRAAESADQKQRLQAMFDERYRLTQEAFAKELGLYDDAVKQKQAKERDWIAGAKAGMDTYVRDASNGYEATKQLAQNTFRSAEDAAVQFATTGKASASDLFSTIVQGLIRIQIQEAMTKMFGGSNGGVLGSLINTGLSWLTGGASATSGAGQYSLTSGGSGGLGLKLPGRATGGPVSAGGMYEVNERGMPELLKVGGKQVLLMAGQSGYVTPLAWQGGGAAGQAAASVGRGLAPMEVNVHNYAGAKVEQRQRSGPDGKVILDLFISEAAAQVAGDYGPMGQAMRQRGRIGG